MWALGKFGIDKFCVRNGLRLATAGLRTVTTSCCVSHHHHHHHHQHQHALGHSSVCKISQRNCSSAAAAIPEAAPPKRRSKKESAAAAAVPDGNAILIVDESMYTEETKKFYNNRLASLPSHEVEEMFLTTGLDYQKRGKELVVRCCPFCHDIKNDPSNMHKLHVNPDKGLFNCFRCGTKGSISELAQQLMGDNVQLMSMTKTEGKRFNVGETQAESEEEVERLRDLQREHEQAVEDLLHEPAFAEVLNYLQTVRGFNQQTIRAYQVGAKMHTFSKKVLRKNGELKPPALSNARQSSETSGSSSSAAASSYAPKVNPRESASPAGNSHRPESQFTWISNQQPVITFPMVAPNESDADQYFVEGSSMHVARLKIRSHKDKSQQAMYPAQAGWGLFGWHVFHKHVLEHGMSADMVVLTEGEFDAMAVYQATGIPALSLPNGAKALHEDCLRLLSGFKKIVLWMDNDGPGIQGAQHFAQRLGIDRCVIVGQGDVHAPKDANDALRAGRDLKYYIDNARPVNHQAICRMTDLRDIIIAQVQNSETMQGVQYQSLPKMNDYLCGHRRGELTVFSGPTGIGKTTVLSQLSLDLCRQGVVTLWGSFEIPLQTFARKMLQQYAGGSLEDRLDDMDQLFGEFDTTMPMYFLRYFGSTSVDETLNAMRFAKMRYDVAHVILDNLQFMTSGQANGKDRFEILDSAVTKLRAFATSQNVHVTLVVHPRKEGDDTELSISSVFGTAKVTQEADNVIFLQRNDAYRYVDIRKNRFCGKVGTIPYWYEEASNSIYEYSQAQAEAAMRAAEERKEAMKPARNNNRKQYDR